MFCIRTFDERVLVLYLLLGGVIRVCAVCHSVALNVNLCDYMPVA